MSRSTLMSLDMSKHGWILSNVPDYSCERLNKLLWLYNGILDIWQGIPQALIMPGFWICCNSEYGVVKYGSEYPWMSLKSWTSLNTSEQYWTNRLPKYDIIYLLLCCIGKYGTSVTPWRYIVNPMCKIE